MITLLRWLTGFLVFVFGLAMLGLDMHIAFRTTQFAHASNFAAGVAVLFLGVCIMWPSIVAPFTSGVSAMVSAWKGRKDGGGD